MFQSVVVDISMYWEWSKCLKDGGTFVILDKEQNIFVTTQDMVDDTEVPLILNVTLVNNSTKLINVSNKPLIKTEIVDEYLPDCHTLENYAKYSNRFRWIRVPKNVTCVMALRYIVGQYKIGKDISKQLYTNLKDEDCRFSNFADDLMEYIIRDRSYYVYKLVKSNETLHKYWYFYYDKDTGTAKPIRISHNKYKNITTTNLNSGNDEIDIMLNNLYKSDNSDDIMMTSVMRYSPLLDRVIVLNMK